MPSARNRPSARPREGGSGFLGGTGPSFGRRAPSARKTGAAGASALDKEVASIPFKGESILLTRRHFLYGILGAGALAAVGGGASAIVGQLQAAEDDELSVLTVPTDAMTTSDALSQVSSDSCMGLVGNFELPYGTLVWASGDEVAACLVPTEGANPLTQVAVLFLSTGSYPFVLEQAVGIDEGFEIYDVRATSLGLVWTEADILDGVWRIYTATLNGAELGEPVLVDEGDREWETPTIAAAGSVAFWQVLPRLDGSHTAEQSLLKRAVMGSFEVSVAYSSTGRMSTPPYALADSVVITPRTEGSSVHHQLTRIDAESGAVLDTLVLPQSMKPLEAGYGETGFTFSFDVIYNYGGGIANLGTYAPMSADASSNYSAAPWFQFARTPSAAPAWCGPYFMVKSTMAVCGVDMASGTYFAFDVQSGSDDYGEYLASTGMNGLVVTYSNIDDKPIDGEARKCCSVRVWTPLD